MTTPRLPVLGTMRFGAWGAQLGPPDVAELLTAAADLGVVDVDLADIYGGHTTNALIGAALALQPALRDRLRLIAKVGIAQPGGTAPHRMKHYDSSGAYLTRAIEQSFTDLGVERLHLLMIHRYDWLTDPAEVAQALEPWLRSGRIEGFGVSNFSAAQTDLLGAHLAVRANQVSLSLADRTVLTDGTHAHALAHGCELMAWSPLGGGELLRADSAVGARVLPLAQRLAGEYGLTDAAQICLAWLHRLPGVRPVLGSTRIERVREAVAAAATVLSTEHWYELLEAARGHEVA